MAVKPSLITTRSISLPSQPAQTSQLATAESREIFFTLDNFFVGGFGLWGDANAEGWSLKFEVYGLWPSFKFQVSSFK